MSDLVLDLQGASEKVLLGVDLDETPGVRLALGGLLETAAAHIIDLENAAKAVTEEWFDPGQKITRQIALVDYTRMTSLISKLEAILGQSVAPVIVEE